MRKVILTPFEFELFPAGKQRKTRAVNTRNETMKKQYDFSKAVRGKFYRSGAVLKLPIYLDNDVQTFVQKIAESKKLDITTVVNDILKSDMQLAEVIQ
jgi:hypothetical protein